MQSNLNVIEFKNKLKNNVKIGHPKLKFFTPISLFFYDSSKPFYGRYDDSMFSLTSNLKVAQTFFILRGHYKIVDKKLDIQFEVLPRLKYQSYWWTFCIVIGFVGLVYLNITKLSESNKSDLIVIDIFYMFLVSFGILYLILGKRNLKKKFIKVFEIYTYQDTAYNSATKQARGF